MKKILLLLAAVVAVLAIVLSLPTPKPADLESDNSFVIGPVNIFDGEKWRDEKFVVVHEGWITELSMQRPDLDLPYREAQGQVLIPGLIDAHVHVWGDALEQSLNFGVTTVIDMFGDPSFLKQHKAARAKTSQARNADLFGAGYLVTAPNGHGTQYGIPVPTLSDPAAAPEAAAKRLDSGSDFIKIVYTHADAIYQPAPSISLAELQATIKAAHQAQQRHFYNNLLLTTERLYAAGVPILAGSDAPNPSTAHGWSLLAELEMLQRTGLPLDAVLHAATAAPAQAFALPHQGRIAVGMKADLLLLNTDASTNLRALFHPQAVWKNGFEL